jgi:hypothetical protein
MRRHGVGDGSDRLRMRKRRVDAIGAAGTCVDSARGDHRQREPQF